MLFNQYNTTLGFLLIDPQHYRGGWASHLPCLQRIQFHLSPWHFSDTDKEHMMCVIEHTGPILCRSIGECASILSNAHHVGIMSANTGFCCSLLVFFFFFSFIQCVYGSNPFLKPFIYSHIPNLDAFYYVEIHLP